MRAQSTPLSITDSCFRTLVERALAELPHEITEHMENVVITIGDWPSASDLEQVGLSQSHQLFGLYHGIPLTKRGQNYNLVTPDRIVLFRGPLLAANRSLPALREHIRRTVVHEIAHHFGISESRIRDLGY